MNDDSLEMDDATGLFPPAIWASPFTRQMDDSSVFMDPTLYDVFHLFPNKKLSNLANEVGKRDNKPSVHVGLLCGPPINGDDWPKKLMGTCIWKIMQEKLLDFYTGIFESAEYPTIKNLLDDKAVEQGPNRLAQNIPNHFILYEGPQETPVIIGAVTYGCEYNMKQRDGLGYPVAKKVFIHYVGTKNKQAPDGSEKYRRIGIGTFMMGIVDHYLREVYGVLPFYLLVNKKQQDTIKFFNRLGYKTVTKNFEDIRFL